MDVGIDERRVEIETLSAGKNYGLGKNSDSRFARDAARFAYLGDAAFDSRSDRNQSTAVDQDCLSDSCLEGISDAVAEGRKGGTHLHHQGRAGGVAEDCGRVPDLRATHATFRLITQ